MQPYSERAAQVACNSQIAVQVLLGSENTDVELVPLKPNQFSSYLSPEEFTARRLRPVGVVGLSGINTLVSFKEPLPSHVLKLIAVAFSEYIRSLLGRSFEELQVAAEVAELERLYETPDYRVN
jgi:hypothetical protein